MENWKKINENYYVSDTGMIKSITRTKRGRSGLPCTIKEKILKLNKNNSGYLIVGLHDDCKTKTCLVHRLVAMAFIDNPNNLKEIEHIDGNKLNNNVSKIRWCTSSENKLYAFELGLRRKFYGLNNGNSKLSDSDIEEIKNNYNNGIKQIDIAKKYNITQAYVSYVINLHRRNNN